MHLPGNFTELHSYVFTDFPIRRKHATEFLFEIYQMLFQPCITPVDFVQPSDLKMRKLYDSINDEVFVTIKMTEQTHILIFLEQVLIFGELKLHKPFQQVSPA